MDPDLEQLAQRYPNWAAIIGAERALYPDQTRPLLAGDDMRGTLERLLAAREPAYATADMILESGEEPHAVLLDKIVDALTSHGLCGDA